MPTLQQTCDVACATLAVWGAPVLCALALVPRFRGWLGLIYVSGYVFVSHQANAGAQLTLHLAGLLYFAALGLVIRRYASRLLQVSTRPALFLLSIVAFLWVPALVWPGALGSSFLPLAWETALCAYSFCVESGRKPPPSRQDSLFFLLVDPTLVFIDGERAQPRSQRAASLRPALRVLWGALLAGPASLFFHDRHRVADWLLTHVEGLPSLLVRGAVLFFAFYLSHSSLASFRIGMTRLLGYDVHERYDYPFLARTPLDFWQRWNTYVGAWFKYYVFFPVGAHLRRRTPLRRSAPHLALAVTMLSVGALHDAYVYSATTGAHVTFVRYFALAAVLMVSWQLSSSLAATYVFRGRRPSTQLFERAVRSLSPMLVAPLIWLCFGWLTP